MFVMHLLFSTQHCDMAHSQRYTYRVLQTIQMKHILSCVWAEPAVWAVLKLL